MITRESPRVRRLRSDHLALEKLRRESSILEFDIPTGAQDPPHEYRIRFFGLGLWRPANTADVLSRDSHEVAIRLGANYPRTMPELAWRTPIFHPNISTSGVVCLGGYGTFWAPSLHLDELCVMLWDMIRYTNYDVKSPYNREAAHWAKTQQQYRFPLDQRPLRDRVGDELQPKMPAIEKPLVPPRPIPPDIEFVGDVIEAEVVDAEIVDSAPREILIIE
jgi:ubiquitin-protein ligase